MLVHSILTHWNADEVDILLAFHQSLDPSVTLVVAYGGREEEFHRIKWPHKVFLSDPSLRGPTDCQNYQSWITAVADWIRSNDQAADTILLTETDHLMLRKAYGEELLHIAAQSKRHFIAKSCSKREGSNSFFYLRHRGDVNLTDLLRELSNVDDSPIYECLATGMLFAPSLFEKIASCKLQVPVFTEVVIPSAIRALGYQPSSFDSLCDFMKHVRYRPTYSAYEVIRLIDRRAWCCHPFKDRKALREIFEHARRKLNVEVMEG